jgi:hypothetical protein
VLLWDGIYYTATLKAMKRNYKLKAFPFINEIPKCLKINP